METKAQRIARNKRDQRKRDNAALMALTGYTPAELLRAIINGDVLVVKQ